MPATITSDPIAFMRQNMVLTSTAFGSDETSAGLKAMALMPYGSGVAKRHGQVLGLYMLLPFTGQANAAALLTAYWCPYAQNATFKCELGTAASLCFTPGMSGCSFGVARHGGGRATVAHANKASYIRQFVQLAGTEVGPGLQASEQARHLRHLLGDNISIIAPDDYMLDHHPDLRGLKATTFGVRTGLTWRFYTQRYDARAVNNVVHYYMRDVRPQI